MSALRRVALPIAVVAAVLLVYLVNPLAQPEGALRGLVTLAFWIAAILLVLALFELRKEPGADEVEVDGPSFVRFLFHNSRAGLFWLPIRIFVGFQWLEAGLHKLFDPTWTGPRRGPPYAPTGNARPPSPKHRPDPPSRSSGIATSSTSSWPATTKAGSRT